ncbi:MAG: M28 family peptidase [Planctomycetes bacterium]|nr:M28 family peptidase [Planctomycetota bacterium]
MIGLALCVALSYPQEPIETAIAEAVAAVEVAELRGTVETLAGFGTRHVLSSTDDPARGTGAARRYLRARFESFVAASGGRLTVAPERYEVAASRLGLDVELVNIVAMLRGTSDANRIYVVGGHYDSRNGDGADGMHDAPGANDDASGTAVAVEVCRVLAAREFPATILFVAYDGEEQGLLGSTEHAKSLVADDVILDGMITNDIVGNTRGMDGVERGGYVRCFSYSPRGNDSVGRSLARAASRAARMVDGLDVKLVLRGDRYGRGGDHRPFAQRGVPAIRLTEPREDYSRQHQDVTERDGEPYADLPEFMDFDYLAQVARLNVALLLELASAPRAPSRVQASGARDAYDTLVRWNEVEGADRYEVVWRDTTAADWEHAKVFAEAAMDRSDATCGVRLVGVCLDDVVVGVRSVGKDGSRSRVQTPPEPDAMANRPVGR